MNPLPPELDALKDKWVGPVRVAYDLPEPFVNQPGVYVWVRRYRTTSAPDRALHGLVIYVGEDGRIPSRMFDHLAQLLRGAQSMWDESGKMISGAVPLDVFKRYRDDLDGFLSTTRAEFERSEYFYVQCDSKSTDVVERATYNHIRERVRQTWKNDPIWLYAFMGNPKTASREEGQNEADPIVASELEGRGVLRWLGLIP